MSSYLWVFGSGIVASSLLQFFVTSPATPAFALTLLNLVPPLALYRGLYELAEYAFQGVYSGQYGMRWSNLRDPKNGLGEVMLIFAIEFVVFTVLALYLEQVVDSGAGSSRHPLFFLDIFKKKKVVEVTMAAKDKQIDIAVEMESPDVAAERVRVESGGAVDDVLIVKSLRKVSGRVVFMMT